ncbi:MAG TPA: VOC family protein [Steroidobacteraceae bacterium]|jgi:glyoxylase I family protein|nr:VOC family protein [Steroidobacteraceae bacterium]
MAFTRRTLIIGASTFVTLGPAAGASSTSTESKIDPPRERVMGIGGLFFRCRDPKKLGQWYQLNLGIDLAPTDYGHPVWQQAAGPTVFSPFPMDTDYFGSKTQAWMVNFRVRNLDAIVAQLRNSNIEVKVDPEKYPNGRFARLHDPEGNPIELWEPMNPP